jgi:hypothetical protein
LILGRRSPWYRDLLTAGSLPVRDATPEAAEPDAADDEADEEEEAGADAEAGPASALPLPLLPLALACSSALSARAASAVGPSGQLRRELSIGSPLISFFILLSCASAAASSPCRHGGRGAVKARGGEHEKDGLCRVTHSCTVRRKPSAYWRKSDTPTHHPCAKTRLPFHMTTL